MKSDLPYIQHIIDSIAAIESYTAGGRDHFMSERLVQDAVIRNFEVIGEAATRLSIATRGRAGALWTKVTALQSADPRLLGCSFGTLLRPTCHF